jgi:hypothetical protein
MRSPLSKSALRCTLYSADRLVVRAPRWKTSADQSSSHPTPGQISQRATRLGCPGARGRVPGKEPTSWCRRTRQLRESLRQSQETPEGCVRGQALSCRSYWLRSPAGPRSKLRTTPGGGPSTTYPRPQQPDSQDCVADPGRMRQRIEHDPAFVESVCWSSVFTAPRAAMTAPEPKSPDPRPAGHCRSLSGRHGVTPSSGHRRPLHVIAAAAEMTSGLSAGACPGDRDNGEGPWTWVIHRTAVLRGVVQPRVIHPS